MLVKRIKRLQRVVYRSMINSAVVVVEPGDECGVRIMDAPHFGGNWMIAPYKLIMSIVRAVRLTPCRCPPIADPPPRAGRPQLRWIRPGVSARWPAIAGASGRRSDRCVADLHVDLNSPSSASRPTDVTGDHRRVMTSTETALSASKSNRCRAARKNVSLQRLQLLCAHDTLPCRRIRVQKSQGEGVRPLSHPTFSTPLLQISFPSIFPPFSRGSDFSRFSSVHELRSPRVRN